MTTSNTTTQNAGQPGNAVLWIVRGGAIVTAAMALWRILLYATSLAAGTRLPVQEAALTFMWIPDLLFLLLFLWLAWRAPRLHKRSYIETGMIASGLQIAFLIATMIVFRRWTDAAALGFGDPLTWLHILLPSLWCAWFFLYLFREFMRQIGYLGGRSSGD